MKDEEMADMVTLETYREMENKKNKRIADLEKENRLLGERCNQLLKDKGELTDKVSNQAESLRITMLEEEKKEHEWHYVEDGKDLPLEAGLHIRVVLHNGNEYICETDYYEPSEDEIGFGHLLIQLYSNNEWIDDNDVYAWCELSMPPKKE